MQNPKLSHVILMVANPEQSGVFYSRLLDVKPIEQSPTFVLFAMPNGIMLGLWSRFTARPEVISQGGGSEICFHETSDDKVNALYAQWVARGIPMALPPTAMDGMSSTFVALDPDGHRIRVFCFEEESHG